MAQTITGTITVVAPTVAPTGAFTPQQYGSPGPAATLAAAQAGVDQFAAIQSCVNAAGKAAAASGTTAQVFLSQGFWFSKSTGVQGGWAGVAIPGNVEVLGEAGTYCTWAGGGIGYPMFSTSGTGATIHDLTFLAPIDGGQTGISVTGTSPHLYNLDYQLGACQNSNSAATYALLENLTVDGTVPVGTLAQDIVAGQVYDSLAVEALPGPIGAGFPIYVASYPTTGTRAEVLQGMRAQRVVLATAATAGATSISVVPVIATEAIPSGSSLRNIVIATGIAMAGGYPSYATTAPGPGTSVWNYQITIKNCTSVFANAANVFIDTGYESTIEDCYGYVGHDMNFDFEYCVKCVMQNNTGRYGGNRGCAVETTNSACKVLNNDVKYAFADGIRVTNDLTPPNDPFPTGGHTVQGNTVAYCNRGIAFQGLWGDITDNTVQFCSLYGVWLYDVPPYNSSAAENTLLSKNKILNNVGAGIVLSNSMNVTTDGTNEVAYNGYLGTIPPNRVAPQASLVGVASSGLASGAGYAVSFGWEATVLGAGGMMQVSTGPQGLPALVTTTAANQGIQFTVTLPTGIDGVMVSCSPSTYYTSGAAANYPIPSASWEDMAYILGQQPLGSVAADGTVTYFANSSKGLSAVVNSDGSLTITVTAASQLNYRLSGTNLASGILFDGDTGGIADVVYNGDYIHDNGYAGMWGPLGAPNGLTINGGKIENHTAIGVWRAGWDGQSASGSTISGSYYGYWAPENGPGATLTNLTISGCTQAIHADGGGQGYTVDGCNFSDCDVGIFLANQSVATGYPWTIKDTTFTSVTTPVDLDGNPATTVVDGGGNTGMVVS